ncbi:MAG: exosortase system-associated protein, TIGR04073 family, partial [Verrucomicrobiales bacterium]
MKKFLVAIALLGIVSVAVADIQAPPKSRQTPTRKLARGLANVLYGWTELPVTVWRSHESGDQATEFIVYGIINGLERTGARIAYGVYEVVNFHRPLYKDSYRPPYTSINYDPTHGFEEFPPQLGYLSTV